MNPEEALSAITGISVIISAIFWLRLRQTKLVYVTDFQVGLRFLGSGSCRVLPPGGYRSKAQQNLITVVDKRPYLFAVERQMLQDALRSNAVISIAGEIVVVDPELSVTAMKNLEDDSLLIIRENLRLTIAHSIVDASSEGRAHLATNLLAELNRALQSSGVKVQNIEITELWAESIEHIALAGAN
jgi:hypothetical protein